MKISTYQISEAVEFNDYKRGKNYFLQSKVLSYEIREETGYSLILHSKVKGSYKSHYIQDIVINQSLLGDDIEIDGDCSCPVGYNCKHVVATCFQFQYDSTRNSPKNTTSNQQDMTTSLVDKWIKDTLAKQNNNSIPITTQNSEDFILYRLFENKNSDDLKIYRSRILKNGKVGRGSMVNFSSFNYAHNDILDAQDERVQEIINATDNSYYYYTIKGTVGNLLIKSLIKTGRCFYQKSNQALKFNPKTISPTIYWGKSDSKHKQLQIDFGLGKSTMIATQPVLVIDKDSHEVYQVSSEVNFATLDAFTRSPDIPNTQVGAVYKNLASALKSVEIETPKDYKVQTLDTKPIPAITIYQEDNKDSVGFLIKLNFLYNNLLCEYQPREQKTHHFEDDAETLITRHLAEESKKLEQLQELGLMLIDEEQTHLCFSFAQSTQQGLMQWSHFLSQDIPQLQDQGWQVNIDDSFKLNFNSDAEIVVESEEDTNDWFSLSFDINVDGKLYPLAPLVSSLINDYDNFDELPEKLLVNTGNLQYIELTTQTIRPVLKTLFELFDRKEPNNDLKIGAFDAHMLEDLEDSVTWKGSKEILKLAKKLKDFEGIEKVKPPTCLKLELRDYQQLGLNWLNFLHQFRFSGILADDMGLGKTVQTLAHLSRLKEDKKLTKPVLIIVPTSLIANWKNEVKKFTPNLNILTLYGLERKAKFKDMAKADLILTTYTLVGNDIEHHQKRKHSYIILDEAQKIKNPRTKMARTICSLKSENRLALTGTPIENHLGELWSIFNFLMPGFLHNQKLFNDYYRKPIENDFDEQMQSQLNKRIKPFILRRTKGDVLTELPAKTEIIKLTQFDAKQSKLYETIRIAMNKKVRDAVTQKGVNRSHIHILDALLKLRQVCCDPSILKLDEAKKVKESAKLDLFLELIDELMSEGRKVLVFSQFTSMLSILEREIKKRKFSYVKLTGSSTKRDKIIDKFTNGEVDIFLISLKAGGVGLNLVEADTVIHYDPWWNPAVENQATDRAHRIGQNKKVFVYKLIVENTIEQKIIELQNKKKALQDGIYDKGGKLEEKKFSGNELMELLKS